jgi:hypothetical protein
MYIRAPNILHLSGFQIQEVQWARKPDSMHWRRMKTKPASTATKVLRLNYLRNSWKLNMINTSKKILGVHNAMQICKDIVIRQWRIMFDSNILVFSMP